MNEELQKQIAAILKQALEAAQHGGQWLGGQIPDVLHQLIVWTIAEGCVFVALFLVSVAVTFLAATKWANQKLDCGFWSCSKTASVIIGGLISFTIGVCAVGYGLDALQALVAPKLFLLEYAAHLVK